MRAFLFVACFASSLMLVSCFDQGDCLFANTSFIKIGIIDKDTTSQEEEVFFDDVFTLDAPNGLLFLSDTTVSYFAVAADPNRTEMKYIFQYEGRSDTLVLGYTNQTIVLSPDCGSYIFQKDLQIKHSTFDSVRITNSSLLRSVETNIEIFL